MLVDVASGPHPVRGVELEFGTARGLGAGGAHPHAAGSSGRLRRMPIEAAFEAALRLGSKTQPSALRARVEDVLVGMLPHYAQGRRMHHLGEAVFGESSHEIGVLCLHIWKAELPEDLVAVSGNVLCAHVVCPVRGQLFRRQEMRQVSVDIPGELVQLVVWRQDLVGAPSVHEEL